MYHTVLCRGKNVRQAVIFGKPVCQKAYYTTVGICRQTFFEYKKLAQTELAVETRRRKCDKQEHVIAAEELFKVNHKMEYLCWIAPYH
jgi:hypothetical protein